MKTLCELFNEVKPHYGNTFQNGVLPGGVKLAKFVRAIIKQKTPAIMSQDGKGDTAIAYVKIFDPCGSWTWFITEYDPKTGEAFGLVNGFESELGYIDLAELANVKGATGIGLELDMHWLPRTLAECVTHRS